MDIEAGRRHDDWNLWAIGSLNVMHVSFWLGLTSLTPGFVVGLFAADMMYLVADLGWLVLSPKCVPPSVRRTLIIHHGIVILCAPFALGHPVLMRHLLRTWIVELNSWVHIAARRLRSQWAREALQRLNKPMFCTLRLVCFPLTWFAYNRDRASLDPVVRAALLPMAVHLPLSIAHFAMYGLMCRWGYVLLIVAPKGKLDGDRP